MIRAENIQINHQRIPMGIAPGNIRVSWIPVDATSQTAYQLILKNQKNEILYNSGKQETAATVCTVSACMPCKEKIAVFLKLWDENGQASEIAETWFETGPELSALQAKWINPEGKIDPKERKPASYLKKTFSVTKLGKGRIYATCHGIFDVYLNGIHLDDKVLMPGTSQYHTRLAVQTIDCTDALKMGENELIVTLGDGWYRGSLSNNLNLNTFGNDVALLLQLEVSGKPVCLSDESWLASQSGPLGLNDLKLGEHYDARKEAITDWHPVSLCKFKNNNLIYPESVPVRKQERFSATLLTTPAGETVLDFGVNLAGFVNFSLEAKAGQKLTLIHGEVLDENGNFTIENYRNPAKKDFYYQQVDYICKEGTNTYCPTKTYFGFRYVKVEADFAIDPAWFTAIAVYSDMPQVGWFSCGNADVNTLFENALRSMKGNFVDIPTDCPTREKDGWSGDAQAFVHTAAYLMDCYDVYAKWLRELAAGQERNGKLPSVAPKRGKWNPLSAFMDGSVGWSDAIEIIPTVLKERYGDASIGEEVYEAMKKWVLYLLNLGKKTRKEHKNLVPKELWPYFVDHGFLWGEWLEPGVDTREYMTKLTQTGDPEVSTAYLCYGSRLVSQFARYLGKEKDAAFFADVSEKAKQAYRYISTQNGRITGDRQCRYVRPVALDLLCEEEKQQAVDALADAVRRNGNKLNTGFLSTNALCRVLTDYGNADTAYDLLLQTDCPSWLYAVKHGATSIWETWDGIREDGSVHDSMNHYSYGAVVSWLFDSVAGIRLENGKITICPHPDQRLGHAEAVYHSPLGKILSKWEYQGNSVIYTIEIPCNSTATICLPDREAITVQAGTHTF